MENTRLTILFDTRNVRMYNTGAKIILGGKFMGFYELCRNLRNQYQEEPNREIELQILTQLHNEFFLNGDKLPDGMTIKVDIKPLLKNRKAMKYWRAISKDVKFPNTQIRDKCFFDTVVIEEMLQLVLYDLGIDEWDIKHFRRVKGWKHDIHISFSKRLMKLEVDGTVAMEKGRRDYLKTLI